MTESGSSRPSVIHYYGPAVLLTLVTCGAILAIHRDSLMTLISAHGLLHLAIAQQFEAGWATIGRPENPFFAGEPLPYYWFYHYVSARLAASVGISLLHAFEILGLIAVSFVWIGGAAVGRAMGWKPGPSLGIGLLALGGANMLGPVLLLAKLAVGRPWPVEDGEYLWGLVHPVMSMARLNDHAALYGPFINFFLNNSSRSLALGLVILCALALHQWLQRGSKTSVVALAFVAAAIAAFSPLNGILLTLSLSGLLTLHWLWSRLTGNRRPLVAAAALCAGCLLAAPSFLHLLGRSGEAGVVVGPRLGAMATVIASAGPLMVLSVIGTAALRQPVLALFTAAGSVLAVGASLVLLPAANETNLFHIGGTMLAIPAAGSFVLLSRGGGVKRLITAALLILLVSSPMLVLWAYRSRPDVPFELRGHDLRRHSDDAALASAYEWLRTTSPPNAALVIDSTLWKGSTIGNVPDFPALTRRHLFVAAQPGYMVRPHADAKQRERIAASLLAARDLIADDRHYLETFGRPIFIVVEDQEETGMASMTATFGAPVFAAHPVAIYRGHD